MVKARRRDEWSRTAALACLIANTNRGKNMPPFRIDQFMPQNLKD